MLAARDQSGTQRVPLHIAAHGQEVRVVLNRKRFEAPLVPMAGTRRTAVSMPPLSVGHRQPPHELRQELRTTDCTCGDRWEHSRLRR